MNYLVDSDWLIDALTGQPDALAVLKELGTEGLAISIIAYGEILEGAQNSPQPTAHLASLREFLAGFTILPIDELTMEFFARHRARLRR